VIELYTTDMVHGGEAIARLDGKAHFVAGALPNERVVGQVVKDKGSWARVDLIDVVAASPARVEPPCPHFARCGGCQWQHADYEAQLDWKRSIVAGQLAHLGGLESVQVDAAIVPGPPYHYRNRMDFKIAAGVPALHRLRSKTLEPLEVCLLLRPELGELFDRLGPLDGARSLTMRVAAPTGDMLVIVEGDVPEQAATWGASVAHRSSRGLRSIIGGTTITEVVAGTPLRITGGSFFQVNSAGAEALVECVSEALSPQPHEVLLDGYAGGGLFGATVGAGCAAVVAIEASPTAVADLRHNLEAADVEAVVYRGDFDAVLEEVGAAFDVAVVDPPRSGLGREMIDVLASAAPRAIAYVSCDPASLARDAGHLAARGYRLDRVRPVDMFPQTYHIEAVASFTLR